MNPVREAIYGRLAGDDDLTGMLGAADAIYHRRADQDAPSPYVIVGLASEVSEWTFEDYLDNDLWLAKAVKRDGSAGVAEDIDARIRVLLNDFELAIDGRRHLFLRRESSVSYGEDDGALTIHHEGGLYRLISQPNA